jgi:hypothetical protein
MKKLFVGLFLGQMLISQAFAGTYVCLAQEGSEAKDAAIVFNVERSALIQTSKAAVLEDGLEEALEDALEASNVEVMTSRCPHCYTVTGTIMGAYNLTLNIQNEESGSYKVTYGDEDSSDAPAGDLDCSFIK